MTIMMILGITTSCRENGIRESAQKPSAGGRRTGESLSHALYPHYCIHICIYVYINIHSCIHIDICIYMFVYMNIYLYMYMYIYIYIYIYITLIHLEFQSVIPLFLLWCMNEIIWWDRFLVYMYVLLSHKLL
jgi:hypothetical protein